MARFTMSRMSSRLAEAICSSVGTPKRGSPLYRSLVAARLKAPDGRARAWARAWGMALLVRVKGSGRQAASVK